MKKILYLTFFFAFCSYAAAQAPNNAQKYLYEVSYLISYQPDSTDISTLQKDVLFTLLLGDKMSVYVNNEKIKLDSILNGIENGSIASTNILANMSLMPKPASNAKIFKYYDKQIIAYNDMISAQNYEYTEPLNIGKWKVHNDKKVIGSYTCQLAEIEYGGREWLAYFTDEIPISDGPYKFNGLPGLILAVTDSESFFKFEFIGLKKNSSFDLNILFAVGNKYEVSKKEFFRIREDFLTNPIPYMEQEGAVFDNANKKKVKEMYAQRKKRNNNPIELKYCRMY
ncbi:MAG: GLPGLI family protein [Prevotellaceae bacterium]|jgi:GLPGLI family protein|nr:GLPGLI family protein [Prevotellaceae bacterium]